MLMVRQASLSDEDVCCWMMDILEVTCVSVCVDGVEDGLEEKAVKTEHERGCGEGLGLGWGRCKKGVGSGRDGPNY